MHTWESIPQHPFHTQQNCSRTKLISNLLPFPTIPAWSSVGEPFSETGRESAPPVALNFRCRGMREKGKRKKSYMKNMPIVNTSNNDNQLKKLSAIKKEGVVYGWCQSGNAGNCNF